MIIINSVGWSDCFSYGKDNFIQLDKHPIVQLVGKNGHGKSSIGLIIEELFFNKNSKGTKRSGVLNRYSGASKYSINGTFNKDGVEYRIESSRGSTQSIKLYKDSEDISAHTATGTLKLIEEIIGMDSNTFAQLIYQSSASSLEFLTATDTNRKKFLINLLNLDEYTKTYELFKDIVKEVSNEVTVLSTKVQSIQGWLDNNKKSPIVEKPLHNIPDNIASIDTSTETNRIAVLSESLKTIDNTNKRINQNNEYKKLLSKIPVEQIVDVGQKIDISKESRESIEVSRTIKDAKAFIKKMGDISDSCPTCSQPVDNSKAKQLLKEQEDIIKHSEQRLKELQEIIDVAEQTNAAVDKVTKYKADYENYTALIDPTMPDLLLDKSDIANEISELEKTVSDAKKFIEEQKAEIKALTEENNKIVAHNARVQLIKEQIVQHTQDLENLSSQLVVLEKRLSILQILQKTFSTNGLVAYKIECMVKDLQNLTNQYLAELSDGRFQINFVMGSTDKLNVIVVDNGLEIDILEISSGERARVNTATLLAIRKLMQTLSSVRLNLLILDETIDNLDLDGKEKLVEVLLQEEYLNTILVSHGYSHPLIEKISVIKENKISRIE